MDDDYIFNEKQSIRKYGSVGNHIRKNETLIRHEIEKSDTLQGISLKYGCSVSFLTFHHDSFHLTTSAKSITEIFLFLS